MIDNLKAGLMALGTVIAIVGSIALCLYLIATNPLLLMCILVGVLCILLVIVFFIKYKEDIERKRRYNNVKHLR